ncbi:MAG: 50S ribosomal protein L15 [Patescibacteria group bacterium]|nr:50S ribosomal protein L15 [Patescibacteria group bacterium]
MPLNLHSLKSTPHSKKKRVGRGNASGHGTYSTRGMKGQRARSGGRPRPAFGSHLAHHLPKMIGFKSQVPKMNIVNLQDINRFFQDGALVNPRTLLKAKLVDNIKRGVKILGQGELKLKNLKVEGCHFSASAKIQIEKKGGKIKNKISN